MLSSQPFPRELHERQWQDTTTTVAGQTKTSEVVYHLVESMQYIASKALHLFLIIF